MLCESCKHWSLVNKIIGYCQEIVPTIQDFKCRKTAYLRDDSIIIPRLYTKAEFGCTLFKEKE